jgi:hypothetical protein
MEGTGLHWLSREQCAAGRHNTFARDCQDISSPPASPAMAGYSMSGLWIPALTYDYLISLPVALPAILLGRVWNHRLRGDAFLRYVHCFLASVGIVLLIQAFR